jgi:protease PrsW
MGLLLSLFFGFVPMFLFALFVYWLDRYEKEPKRLLAGAFGWGAVIAAGAAFVVNTGLGIGIYLFTQSEAAADLTTGSLIAPVVEESLKGLAVLIVFLLFRREFDSTLDGIVYAAVAALGFSATENTFYIYQHGFLENGYSGLAALVFIRVILVGWQHPFYTSFIGIGLSAARLSRSCLVKGLAPLVGWTAAVIAHSLHNTLASLLPGAASLTLGTFLDWSGWIFMFFFIIYLTNREGKMINRYIKEEMEIGTITARQYQTACSAWSQTAARFSALFNGSFASTSRFYQVCGEISHKKRQLMELGDEEGNTQILEGLRTELKGLSARAFA